MKAVFNSKTILSCFALLFILVCSSPGQVTIIDDFEDGVINTDIWWYSVGNYAGGEGWGDVYEANGQLVLDCIDIGRHGGGVSIATLRTTPLDARIYFSFELTLEDDTLDGGYIPYMVFCVTDNQHGGDPRFSVGGNQYIVVYMIWHDQLTYTNQFSGTYYFYLDSATQEARLYNAADDSLLGTISYSILGTDTPYICFNAYSDTYNGAVYKTFKMEEIWTEETVTAPIQWRVADGGNDHWYEIRDNDGAGLSWESANALAESLTYSGYDGHLVSITSAAENQFILDNLLKDDPLAAVFIGAFRSDQGSPWQWTDGENWGFTYWDPGEPRNHPEDNAIAAFSNLALSTPSGADILGGWNDLPPESHYGLLYDYGYLVEYGPSGPPPQPDIEVSPGYYDFGSVEKGSSESAMFSIYNVGNAELIIDDIVDSFYPFSLTLAQVLPVTVIPDDFIEVEVEYSPLKTNETYFDFLKILSNDPDNSPLWVPLFGDSYKDKKKDKKKDTEQHLFLSGINVATFKNQNSEGDIGHPLGVQDQDFIDMFDEVHKAGGNCVRLWLHPKGLYVPTFNDKGEVIGISQNAIDDLKNILNLAWRKDKEVNVILCLWNFEMLKKTLGNDKKTRNQMLLTDPKCLDAYIENALIPLVDEVGGHDAIIAWEIFNEPEGMAVDSKRQKEYFFSKVVDKNDAVEMYHIQRAVNRMAHAIHNNASKGTLVTNGTHTFATLSDEVVHNYYSKERLKEAGKDKNGKEYEEGYLDFYSVHWYPVNGEDLSPFEKPFSYWKLDKEIVIAELHAIVGDEYKKLYDNGYAGALAWSWTDVDFPNKPMITNMEYMSKEDEYKEHVEFVPGFRLIPMGK